MSKITELRRQATDAVRSRRWDKAVQLYERVCDLDSGNASYRNELGDIYLKMGDVTQAVGAFVAAADLYRGVGLTNNAVAVHKKILRHDPNHLDSLWGLGEIRLEQGLETEAVSAYLDFVNRGEHAPAAARPSILERCDSLLGNLGSDPQVLSALETLFEMWEAKDLQARVFVAKAVLAHDAGEADMAEKYIERARTIMPELDALPDYMDYLKSQEGPAADRGLVTEPGQIELDGGESGVIELPGEEDVLDLSDEDIDLGFDFGGESVAAPDAPILDSSIDSEPASEPVEPAIVPEVEIPEDPAESEEFEIGPGEASAGGDETSGTDLSDEFQAPSELPAEPEPLAAAPEDSPAEFDDSTETAPAMGDPVAEEATPVVDPENDGAVDLLSELLAEGGLDLGASDESQIDTIAQEMEGQIAGQVLDDDYAGQYDLGIVYMDMGLFDQAIAAFDRASAGEEQRLKAIEMKGSCYLGSSRPEEAMSSFQDGLAVPGYPARYYLGLLYGVGACHEADGRLLEAIDYFERVAQVDENFQDVATRLASLHQLAPDEA